MVAAAARFLRPPTTLRERCEALARSVNETARPAIYRLDPPIPPSTTDRSWQLASFRLQQASGPFLICGLVDQYFTAHGDGPLGGILSLQIGNRRALHEVDAYAVCSTGGASPAYGQEATRRIDWAAPLVCARGELVQLEARVDPPGFSDPTTYQKNTAFVVVGLHVSERIARFFSQPRAQLWARTLTCASSAAQLEAVAEYTAENDVVLDELMTAGAYYGTQDNGDSPTAGADVDALRISIGTHLLTPQPLTFTGLARGEHTRALSSLSGITLKKGEVLQIRQLARSSSPAVTQRYTILGRQ